MTDLIKYCLVYLFVSAYCSSVHAEPLRLLVPSFTGPNILSQKIRTTVYLELVKSFKQVGSPEKGVWILYGNEDMQEATHDAAIKASTWPSVRADVAVWGQVLDYNNTVVIQLYFTITPIIEERKVRPEKWNINAVSQNGKSFDFQVGVPGLFYEFEPLVLSKNSIINFERPQGIPVYNQRHQGQIIGNLGEVIYFLEIHDDAIRIKSDNITGWVKTANIGKTKSEAIPFSQGIIRLMRGDYSGAISSFSVVLDNQHIPQMLRIHSLIYIGLAKEKKGSSGISEFNKAFNLNRLEKNSASFLLMGRVADIVRAIKHGKTTHYKKAMVELRKDLKKVKLLFPNDDDFIRDLSIFSK